LKIAVYSIALNEEKFIERWYNSAKDADIVLLADTGSTDNTEKICKKLGIKFYKISIKPWRFEDARNASLALIPDDIDYCIALDVDEVLVEGWREHLEKATATRPRYKYTWSWNEDGSPGLQYNGDKIHKRHNYRWKHPVHEVLTFDRIEETQEIVGLEIHHHPDPTKSRSQYFPLLELSVKEDPSDDRNAYYFARELFFNNMHDRAAEEFKRHLSLPRAVWGPERASSHRYLAKCEPQNAEQHLLNAISESARREAFVELADHYHKNKNWIKTLEYAEKALEIKEKPLDYLCEAFAWGWLPYDLAALGAHYLGNREKAIEYGKLAISMNPEDKRLKLNLIFYNS
jgi:glycosyltransferase involved in cell wall biosynthesis